MPEDPKLQAAIDRLPGQSTSAIKQVRANADRLGASSLVEACERELALRGDLDLTGEQARQALENAERVRGRPLEQVIEAAFQAIPAQDYERALLKVLHGMPGATFQEVEERYGRRDTALVAGHLVYDRFGFFRQFIGTERDQSSILLVKAKRDGQVTWALKDEAVSAFSRLGLL